MILRWVFILWLSWSTVCESISCPYNCDCGFDDNNIQYAICKKGGMTFIPITSFDSNVQIIHIEGPKNYLTIGPIFDRVKDSLKILRIMDSNIPAIGQYSFLGLIYLRHLDLSTNNITTISEDNFIGLNDLTDLNLADNKIDRMPSNSFQFLKGLRALDISYNLITQLAPRQFLPLPLLKSLDLSGNPLYELPVEIFSDVKHLNTLKCRYCILTEIDPKLFRAISGLHELDFGYNQISVIHRQDLQDLKKLKTLKLDGNKLMQLNQFVFEHQRSLQFIDLSHNEIQKIHETTFSGLRNLSFLDLSYNKLEYLNPRSVEPLIYLNFLNLSGNSYLDLMEMKITFKYLQDLDSLSMTNMLVKFPDDIFDSLSQLKFLNLSQCNLETEDLIILNPIDYLRTLDISRNNIIGMTENLSNRLQRINNVKLDDNPLICDRCHLGPLIGRAGMLKWDEIPTCHQPESLRGAKFDLLDAGDLELCLELTNSDTNTVYYTRSSSILNEGFIGASIILAAVLIISIVLLLICLYSRHGAKYYTHEDKVLDNHLEKNIDGMPIANNEINFKFPLDDVCTIDEICLPPPPPTPTKKKNHNHIF